jgi:DNA/RNA endonuclease YhcR with UshA esterase domain
VSVTGVLSIFGTTYQLYIRDLNDVKDSGLRCSGTTGGGGGGNEVLRDLISIRSLFSGTKTTAPENTKIKGIVISDRSGKNLNGQNLYLQDGTAGIVVRFGATHSFDLGDEIEVVVSKQEISEFNSLLQLNNVPLANAKVLRKGQSVTPREATIAEIVANFDKWESTLVRIKNATITGGATLSGGRTVNDGTGSIVMFTQTAATFAGTATPAAPVTLTAIVSDFNAKQVILRNAADIQP